MKTWIVSSLDYETIQGEETIQGRKLYEDIRYIECRNNPWSIIIWTSLIYLLSLGLSLTEKLATALNEHDNYHHNCNSQPFSCIYNSFIEFCWVFVYFSVIYALYSLWSQKNSYKKKTNLFFLVLNWFLIFDSKDFLDFQVPRIF